jgi:hypothetical protein
MTRRDRDPRRPPTPVEDAQIRAVLDLDVARENELIRERLVEIVGECAAADLARPVPALAAELAALGAAYEGWTAAEGGAGESARDVVRGALALARRIDAGL